MMKTRTRFHGTGRRSQGVLVGLGAASVLLLTAACSGNAAGSDDSGRMKATMGSAAFTINFAVPGLMDSLGLDLKNGIDIEYTPAGASSTNPVAGVISGDLTFAVVPMTTAIDAVDRGSPLVLAACTVKGASSLALRKDVVERTGVSPDSPVQQRVRALRGLTIATSPEGSGNNTILRTVLKGYGLNPDTDVRIIGVQDPTAIVGGIKQGQFDGGFFGAGVTEENIAAGEATLWLSMARGDLTSVLGDALYGGVVVRRDVLDRDPALVDAMFASIVSAEQLIADDPARAATELKTRWMPALSPTVFDTAWAQAKNAFPTDGRCPRAGVDVVLAQMRNAGGAYANFDYDSFVNAAARG